MGSSIILKLLNVTTYYRDKKAPKWYLPYGYGANDIELNNISLHIYKGEALAIIGEAESSKALIGRLLSGEIKPDKGKVVRKRDVFFADISDKKQQDDTVHNYVSEAVSLFSDNGKTNKTEELIKEAQLNEQTSQQINQLSDISYANLLFVLAKHSKASVIIFNHIIEHLDDTFVEQAIALSESYIEDNLTIISIDDNLERVEQTSNYATWISHGQLRMTGSVSEVFSQYREHESDWQSLETEDERSNFDLDWKKKRTRVPELSYNFRRTERYEHINTPHAITRFWTILLSCLAALLFVAVLLFNNVGVMNMGNDVNHASIQTKHKDTYEEKLAYGINLKNKVKLKGLNHNKNISAKRYAFLTITGENSKNYRIIIDNKQYTIPKNQIRYFDPAGLFEKHSLKALSPYIHSKYSKFNEFYNGNLHKSHKKVTDSLKPKDDKDNRLVTPILQQPMSMIFNDRNDLTGFVVPIKDKAKLKKKFNIDSDFWIVKSGDGYFMADVKNNKWIYIEL